MSGKPGVARFLAMSAAVILPPAAVVWTGMFQKDHRTLWLILLGAYELILVTFGVASAVFKNVRERWIERFSENLDQGLQRLFSRYTRSYLRHIDAANSYVDLKGLATRGEHTLSLDEIYVQLTIDPRTLHKLSSHPFDPARPSGEDSDASQSRAEHASERTVWHWLARVQSERSALAIIGPPGSGKTTLLKNIAYALSSGGDREAKRASVRRIPVLIVLRDHIARFANDETMPSLPELIRSNLREVDKIEPPRWTETRLKAGSFLIMLDGLDEMAEAASRKRVCEWVDRQRETFPETIFVVTSRPFGYKENPLNVATVVQVNSLDAKQVRSFLHKWYLATTYRSYNAKNDAAKLAASKGYEDLKAQLKASPVLSELAANPLLATMIANVHHYRGALPNSRLELYKEVCEVFLGKRHLARGVPVDMSASQKQVILQHLANAMMNLELRDIHLAAASEILKTPLENIAPDVDAATFLRRAEESSGLILERENGVYSFAHLTFQEYLTACHLKESGLGCDLVTRVDNPWWRETILLFAAQSDSSDLIVECLRTETGDTSRLSLAVECEAVSQQITVAAREKLREMRYPANGSSKDAILTAGALRLYERARTFRHVYDDLYLHSSPITNAEYLLFLQSTGSQPPDHWSCETYPSGQDDHPVLGLRRKDAHAFCAWLSEFLNDGHHYGLPGVWMSTPSARLQHDIRDFLPEQFGLSSYWTSITAIDLLSTIMSPAKDSRIVSAKVEDDVAIGPHSESIRWDGWPSDTRPTITFKGSSNVSVPTEELLVFLAEERSRIIAQTRRGPGGDYVESELLELGTTLDSKLLSSFFDEGGAPAPLVGLILKNAPAVLDTGGLLLDIEAVAKTCDQISQLGSNFAALSKISQALGFFGSTGLNRARSGNLLERDATESRLLARLLAVACAEHCKRLNLDPAEMPGRMVMFMAFFSYRIFRLWSALRMQKHPGTRIGSSMLGRSVSNVQVVADSPQQFGLSYFPKSVRAFTAMWMATKRPSASSIFRLRVHQEVDASVSSLIDLEGLLYSIVYRLILLELRIECRVEPTEGLVLVRGGRANTYPILSRASHISKIGEARFDSDPLQLTVVVARPNATLLQTIISRPRKLRGLGREVRHRRRRSIR